MCTIPLPVMTNYSHLTKFSRNLKLKSHLKIWIMLRIMKWSTKRESNNRARKCIIRNSKSINRIKLTSNIHTYGNVFIPLPCLQDLQLLSFYLNNRENLVSSFLHKTWLNLNFILCVLIFNYILGSGHKDWWHENLKWHKS